MRQRVAILWHERQPRDSVEDYGINNFVEAWRDAGLEVVHVFGVDEFVPADVAVVHVDLSVVPDRYLRFAARYPVALNGRLRDIRKSMYTNLRLTRTSEHTGQVIVKTDRNHGGQPEKRLAAFAKLRHGPARWQRRQVRRWTRDRLPYRIYDGLSDVPLRYFVDRRFIVERLVPEEQDGLFWVRYLYVFGGRTDAVRVCSDKPIVKGVSGVQTLEPDPHLVEFARGIGLEYGKIDYVVHDGETFVLDVNKTLGLSGRSSPEVILAGRRRRAQGIYDYLPDPTPTAFPRAVAPAASSVL